MDILGVILAGGQGKRMGTTDKGALDYQGKPLAHHVYDRLNPQVDRMIIAGPNDYGLPLIAVPDPVQGFHGPLMGLYAALKWNEEQANPASAIITAPVDCPFTPTDLVEALLHNQETQNIKNAYLADVSRRQPTFALWLASCLPKLETALFDNKIRAMKQWIDYIGAVEIKYCGDEELVNFNRPEDMK
jgi:molybdopterin-guanine dinucleotide biosynthesis protein A